MSSHPLTYIRITTIGTLENIVRHHLLIPKWTSASNNPLMYESTHDVVPNQSRGPSEDSKEIPNSKVSPQIPYKSRWHSTGPLNDILSPKKIIAMPRSVDDIQPP